MRRKIAVLCFIGAILSLVLGTVANYAYPHGPSYPTGIVECMNDERGRCGEVWAEDLTAVDIPDWVRYSRNGLFLPLVIGLGIVGLSFWVKREPVPPIESWREEYWRLHNTEPSDAEYDDWIREHGDYFQRAALARTERLDK